MLPVTGLGLMGGLRKPTLLVSPSTVAAPPKSFGSDGNYNLISHFNWKLHYNKLTIAEYKLIFILFYILFLKLNL